MLVITAWDLNDDWLQGEGYLNDTFPITKSTKKNADGTKYKVIASDIRLPIDINEAAYLCGDEDILDEVKAEYGLV